MNKSTPLTALALAASVSTSVYAQTSQNTELEPIIVSGGISPVAADEFGRSNTIITRRDIEDSGYATVQQALEAQPGISINGDAPSNRQIRIRGGEANHTLILIDGVRAAAGDSEFFLRGLDSENIEQIEVLRGPQSVPYGTDASAGVVNIVTREPVEGVAYGAAAEYGEGDRQSGYVTFGGRKSELSVNVARRYDAGYDYSGDGGERDTTTWKSLRATGGMDIGRDLEAQFVLRAANGEWDSDALAPNEDVPPFASTAKNSSQYIQDDTTLQSTDQQRLGSVSLTYESLSARLRQTVRFDRTENDTVPSSGSPSEQQTDVAQYRIEFAADGQSVTGSDQVLALLVDRKEDSGESLKSYKRRTDSVALEYQGYLGEALSLQTGIRRDDNDEFSDETTWSIAASYFLDGGVRLHASAGRAIVNPGFASIFGTDGRFASVGNPNLKPEENQGYDLGVEVPLPKIDGFVDITYFDETLTDEIEYISDADPYNYINQDGDSDRRGVEINTQVQPTRFFTLAGSYTYLDATEPDGSQETRRPRHEVGVTADWHFQSRETVISTAIRHVRGLYDDQFWDGGDTGVQLPNFTTLDLAATHTVNNHLELIARVTNALDEDYQEVWGYATRGRAGFVGIRTSW